MKEQFFTLLEKYKELVRWVETQELLYDDNGVFIKAIDYRSESNTQEEYLNDISSRVAIQSLIKQNILTEAEFNELKSWDERLKKQYVGNKFALRDNAKAHYPEKDYWFFYGHPRGIDFRA